MMLSLVHSKVKSERGATMPEFALAFPLIMLLIVFLIDAGLYLYQNSLLIDATASINRQITTKLGQREAELANNVTCDMLLQSAKDAKRNVKILHPELYKSMTFKLDLNAGPGLSPTQPYRLLILRGAFQFQCLTCKIFAEVVGTSLTLFSTSVLAIERPPGESCLDFTTATVNGPQCLTRNSGTNTEDDPMAEGFCL